MPQPQHFSLALSSFFPVALPVAELLLRGANSDAGRSAVSTLLRACPRWPGICLLDVLEVQLRLHNVDFLLAHSSLPAADFRSHLLVSSGSGSTKQVMKDSQELLGDGFIYVGVRPFGEFAPRNSVLGEAMTLHKYRAIAEHRGRTLTLKFDVSDQNFQREPASISPFLEFSAHLISCATPEIDKEAFARDHVLSSCDGIVIFHFRADSGSPHRKLYDRRDPHIGNTSARHALNVHWGTQNWGGLMLEIHNSEQRLFRAKIDIFSPEDDDLIEDDIIIVAYSLDQTRFQSQIEGSTERTQPTPSPISEDRAPSNHEMAKVGTCLTCGSVLYIDRLLYMITSASGGMAIVPCDGCKRSALVKLLNKAESAKAGYFSEVIHTQDF